MDKTPKGPIHSHVHTGLVPIQDRIPSKIITNDIASAGHFVYVPSLVEEEHKAKLPDVRASIQTQSVLGVRKALVGSLSLPPKLKTTVAIDHVFRFKNTSDVFTSVSFDNLMTAGGVLATSASTASSLASCCKLHSIRVWPAPGGSCDVFWATAEGREVDEVSDKSIPSGCTVTGSVSFIPPRNALVYDWTSIVAAANAFAISAPIGSIVDVHISYKLANAFANLALTGLTVSSGTVYYTHLDGAGGTYVPVGMINTI